jgi:hypothetical protein
LALRLAAEAAAERAELEKRLAWEKGEAGKAAVVDKTETGKNAAKTAANKSNSKSSQHGSH